MLRHWGKLSLVFILIFALVTRLVGLSNDQRYQFDEVYHVVTARLMSENDPRAYEWWHPAPEPNTAIDWLHPPLAKLVQAFSINIFGNHAFAWRFPSAVAGTLGIGLVFWLARRLKFSESASLLAAGLLSLDGLWLTISRITMNDVFVSVLLVATAIAWTYWREKPQFWTAFLVAVFSGLATACKWSGIFSIGAIATIEGFGLLSSWWQAKSLPKKWWEQRLQLAGLLAVMLPLIYFASYGQMFMQGKGMAHWWQLHEQIWGYQTGLTATHPYQSKPVEWWLNLRPVYVSADYSQAGVSKDIYFFGNPLVFWAGAAAASWLLGSVLGQVLRWGQLTSLAAAAPLKNRTKLLASRENLLDGLSLTTVLALLTWYGWMWLPWVFSPRIMFMYHYAPALPFLVLIIAYVFNRAFHSKLGQILVLTFCVLTIITFALFFPHWTAGPVSPESWLWKLYYLIPTWR